MTSLFGGTLFPPGDPIDSIDPVTIGAHGDGITNDAAALLAAFNTGLSVDGHNRTYAINGSIAPTLFKGFKRAKLIQTNPVTGTKTLYINNLTDFNIEDITVDLGGAFTTGLMANTAGIWVEGAITPPTRFTLRNIRCTNGGPGNGIAVNGCNNFILENIKVDNFFHNIGATDDVIQGVWLNNCSNFEVKGGELDTITGLSTVKYTRGYAIGGCSNYIISGVRVNNCDQCFDTTGSLGNSNFTYANCHTTLGGTYGFKFANSSFNGIVTGCTASDAGLMGFIISGPTEVINPLPQNIDFNSCIAINPGSNGVWPGQGTGFRVLQQPSIDPTYPRGIRFNDCVAIDNQAVATMINGFVCDVAPIVYPTVGYDKNYTNTANNCKAIWTRTAHQTTFSGMHQPYCQLTGTSVDTLTTGVFSELNWDVTIKDTSGLHNVASSSNRVWVKEPGDYEVTAVITFASNATGIRSVQVTLNGTLQGIPIEVGAHPTLATCIQYTSIVHVDNPGDSIGISAKQTSGGNLNTDRTKSMFIVNKIR